jgi:hypothetical protein
MEISGMFSDPAFRWHADRGRYGTNLLYHNAEARIGVVVVKRSQGGEDFALSKAALNQLYDAEQAQRIAEGYVVLACGSNGSLEFLTAERIEPVYRRLYSVPPREGRLGEYWWLDKRLHLAGSVAISDLPDAPF